MLNCIHGACSDCPSAYTLSFPQTRQLWLKFFARLSTLSFASAADCRVLTGFAGAYLGLLHSVEVESKALEVDHEVIGQRLDGASLLRVECHRTTLTFHQSKEERKIKLCNARKR